ISKRLGRTRTAVAPTSWRTKTWGKAGSNRGRPPAGRLRADGRSQRSRWSRCNYIGCAGIVRSARPPITAGCCRYHLGKLRGVRESGAIFGLPTYFFIVCFSGMIVVGLVKLVIGGAPGTLLHTAPASQQIVAASGLTIFLVLRAFSSGAAAVTGIEAISNGVPAF